MKKMIFVDGCQGVGKSTLISGVCKHTPVYVYKFPFSEYSKTFNLTDKQSLKGFQLGKDLATLYFIGQASLCQHCPCIVDRGPLSTVYYSLTTGRMSYQEVDDFFKILSKSSNNFSFIFVRSVNQGEFTRAKGDGFDSLKSQEVNPSEAVDLMLILAKKHNVPIEVFENDFSIDLDKNISKFYQLIKDKIWR